MKKTAKQMGIKIGDTVEILEGKYKGAQHQVVDIGVTTNIKIDIPIPLHGNPSSSAWIPAKSVRVKKEST